MVQESVKPSRNESNVLLKYPAHNKISNDDTFELAKTLKLKKDSDEYIEEPKNSAVRVVHSDTRLSPKKINDKVNL